MANKQVHWKTETLDSDEEGDDGKSTESESDPSVVFFNEKKHQVWLKRYVLNRKVQARLFTRNPYWRWLLGASVKLPENNTSAQFLPEGIIAHVLWFVEDIEFGRVFDAFCGGIEHFYLTQVGFRDTPLAHYYVPYDVPYSQEFLLQVFADTTYPWPYVPGWYFWDNDFLQVSSFQARRASIREIFLLMPEFPFLQVYNSPGKQNEEFTCKLRTFAAWILRNKHNVDV
jgi:hypothetical protein